MNPGWWNMIQFGYNDAGLSFTFKHFVLFLSWLGISIFRFLRLFWIKNLRPCKAALKFLRREASAQGVALNVFFETSSWWEEKSMGKTDVLVPEKSWTVFWVMVFQKFLFSPRTLGKWSNLINLTNIFQRGWNHQLVFQDGSITNVFFRILELKKIIRYLKKDVDIQKLDTEEPTFPSTVSGERDSCV